MKRTSFLLLFSMLFLLSCGGGNEADSASTQSAEKPQSMLKEKVDPMQDKGGVGPIQSVTLAAEIDQDMAAKGKEVYDRLCTACHKPTERFIGPAPQGILDRRSPEWVMNMILNPEQMVKENEAAKKLLMEYNGSPMANQNLTEEEARQVLEYFRTL